MDSIMLQEVTGQVVYQRQMETLLRLDKQTAEDTSIKQFWTNFLTALEPNKHEVPFAALYSASQPSYDQGSDSSLADDRWSTRSSSSAIDHRVWGLEGTIGIPDDSTDLPSQLDIGLAVELFSSRFEECMATSSVQLLTIEGGAFSTVLQKVARSRAYGGQCTAVVLCPIGPVHRSVRSGFLVLGVSPRREYDSVYQQFVRLLVRQAATTLASVGVHADEARQARRAAELADIEREQLSRKLALTEMEVQQNEHRFRQVGEHMYVSIHIGFVALESRTDHSCFFVCRPVAMYEVATNGKTSLQTRSIVY